MAKKSDDDLPSSPAEVLPPEPAYNDPDASPQEFLMAVMHDKRLPMQCRIQAAKDVAVYVHARLAQVTQDMNAGITIRIEGGLPALPGTNIIMPNVQGSSSSAHLHKGNGKADPEAS